MNGEPNPHNITAGDLPRTFGRNNNGSSHGDARMQTKANARVNHDDDFDLRENYRNAVECLIQCEFALLSLQNRLALKDERIASLERQLVKQMAVKDVLKDGQMMRESFRQFQEQLAVKDELIAGLENRLVETSIELASSKTLEDELRHAFSSCVRGTKNGGDERPADDAPVVTEASLSASRKALCSTAVCAPARPRSKSFSDTMASRGTSSHNLRHASGPQKIRQRRQRGFSMSGLRMSWGTTADSSALDDSCRRSRNVLERIFRDCDAKSDARNAKEQRISRNTDGDMLASNLSTTSDSNH